METITAAQKHLASRGNGKERYLVWNTSLKTAIATPGRLCLRKHVHKGTYGLLISPLAIPVLIQQPASQTLSS